jgi:hypothetical protein
MDLSLCLSHHPLLLSIDIVLRRCPLFLSSCAWLLYTTDLRMPQIVAALGQLLLVMNLYILNEIRDLLKQLKQ